jgi:predicted PurR-regulated permease PerM
MICHRRTVISSISSEAFIGGALSSHISPAQLAATNSATQYRRNCREHRVRGSPSHDRSDRHFFIGLYGAIEPQPYARGIVSLVSQEKRPRAHHILQQTAQTLWYWELGRLFSMTVIGMVTGIGLWLLGVPVPGALGLLAGILTFVPYVGTVVSAIPAALLALTIDARLAVYANLLHVGAHTLEGYILLPLVQKRAAQLPPALTLSTQAILGAIIGIVGLALAAPLTAAGLVLTRLIYVEGTLGDPKGGLAGNDPSPS